MNDCFPSPARRLSRWSLPGGSWLLVWLLLPSLWAAEPQRTAGLIAQGTPAETPYYLQETSQPGPVLFVIGGLHGNEPAGAYAADQIRHWPLTRGRIVVLPRANAAALKAGTRHTPGAAGERADLNRNFPKAGEPGPVQDELAAAIWKLVQEQNPDWLIDLHEGSDFSRINSQSVGNTIIVQPGAEADAAVKLMLEAVNATITDPQMQFHRRAPPVNGSLARAAGEHLPARSLILETTTKSQPLSLRARQHRLMVHTLLRHLEMIGPEVEADWITDRLAAPRRTRVALYDSAGSTGQGVPRVQELLSPGAEVEIVLVGPREIAGGALGQFDLVMFTGGSGSGQANAIGEVGRQRVKEFVEQGGGFVGICAGAYLATSGFSWGLKILEAQTASPLWRRGRGQVQIELTPRGRELFGQQLGTLEILYVNGPILVPAQTGLLPAYEPLAFFRSELAENGTPAGLMINSPAIVAGLCGKGRVICFSPHPEQTKGLEDFIRRAVDWAAGGETP